MVLGRHTDESASTGGGSMNPMDALTPERGLKPTPETLKAAHLVLNRLYEADHQVLFELTKMLAFQTARIVRGMQGGSMDDLEALVDGMQWIDSLLSEAEAEAREGYRPTPVAVWKPEGGSDAPR